MDALLKAVADRSGRVVLVAGAGCSLESPTGLRLGSFYAQDVHRQLLLDHVLDGGECSDPSDLSEVASAVFEKLGQQADVVSRLPIQKFRTARPNAGHLIAAALLQEGAVSSVLTLNFDLAFSTALTELSAQQVTVIPGPHAMDTLGSSALIYLHCNVDEQNKERWILRREALESEWQGTWQELVANRVMTAPVVVFAGLGSPAAVLTETIDRIRAAMGATHATFVVDPSPTSTFAAQLEIGGDSHIHAGWCDFMALLDQRVAAELQELLEQACLDQCQINGWTAEQHGVRDLCKRFFANGLVAAGQRRAIWLLDGSSYTRDDSRRGLVADLLLGVGLAERQLAAAGVFTRSGVVEVAMRDRIPLRFLPISGAGTYRWLALEAKLGAMATELRELRLDGILISGVSDGRPAQVVAPADLVHGEGREDIVSGATALPLLLVDELRADPSSLTKLIPT